MAPFWLKPKCEKKKRAEIEQNVFETEILRNYYSDQVGCLYKFLNVSGNIQQNLLLIQTTQMM